MTELRSIPGFPHHKASSEGQIWSDHSETYLRQYASEKDYSIVYLSLNGKRYKRKVHRLVAAAFYGPCPQGMQVRHGVGGKSDNTPANLSYGTQADNEQDKYRDGTMRLGEDKPGAILTTAAVLEIRTSKAPAKELAVQFGVSRNYIGRIKRREKWTHV